MRCDVSVCCEDWKLYVAPSGFDEFDLWDRGEMIPKLFPTWPES